MMMMMMMMMTNEDYQWAVDLCVVAGTSLVIIVTLAVGIWLAILAIGIVCLRKYVDLFRCFLITSLFFSSYSFELTTRVARWGQWFSSTRPCQSCIYL